MGAWEAKGKALRNNHGSFGLVEGAHCCNSFPSLIKGERERERKGGLPGVEVYRLQGLS